MVRGKKGTLHLEFNPFRALSFVVHGIFTRMGGQSAAPFGSLNVGLSTGDDRQMVEKNRQIIAETLGNSHCIYLNQVHSDTVLVLQGSRDEYTRDTVGVQVADALVTNIPNLALAIQVADCQPVLLVDPVKKVVANIHSGWKGSISNIIGKSVDAMYENFGSNPKDILAGIGPSLGPCCSEFINYTQEIPAHLWQYKDEKDHFDFWRISQDQLINKGVAPENITLAGVCTKCSADAFFSYRNNNTTGRFAAIIKITSTSKTGL
jgi:YfiH family protein